MITEREAHPIHELITIQSFLHLLQFVVIPIRSQQFTVTDHSLSRFHGTIHNSITQKKHAVLVLSVDSLR